MKVCGRWSAYVEFQGRAELLRRDASGKEVRHVHLYDAESASAWA